MTAELSSRIHTAAVTALAFVCTYVLAFYWNLDRPFWAGFTVFVISLPSIGQTLQKGVLRMFGTIAGAVAALVLLGLFAQERMLWLRVLHFLHRHADHLPHGGSRTPGCLSSLRIPG